jgi:hypothetical protein
MNYTQITTDWNADPNAPEVQLTVNNNSVTLEFYLNYFLFDNFQEGDKAKLTFNQCYKYALNGMNDEGYFQQQYRYRDNELPWGEFYKLETNWEKDFPMKHRVLYSKIDKQKLNHYIFFFKDNTFECVAQDFQLEFNLQSEKHHS